MSYATINDLIAEFGEDELIDLTDLEKSGEMDDAALKAALTRAGALIDAHIASRYVVPVATPGALLKGLCCDLARFYLYDQAPPDAVKSRQGDAMEMLRAIRDGFVVLPGAATVAAPAVEAAKADGGFAFSKPSKSFTTEGFY